MVRTVLNITIKKNEERWGVQVGVEVAVWVLLGTITGS